MKVHDSDMKRTTSACYLADYINESGSNDETIKSREIKAIGIVSQIASILKNVTLGIYYFQTALILRDAMLINGILTNAEAWNYISVKQYKILEDIDHRAFSTIFECNRANRVLFYLETAKVPIRYVVSKRRMMYHHHILSRNKDTLIRKIYEVQKLSNIIKYSLK